MWSRAARFLIPAAILTAVLTSLLLLPRGAEAHAVQVGSEPESNAQVATSPPRVSVTFSEEVESSVTSLQLFDQEANEVALGALSFPSATDVTAPVPQALEMGIYTVVWRNLSKVDGHTWAGSYTFAMLGPNGEVPEGTASPELKGLIDLPSTNPNTLEAAARWLVLLGSATLLGGAAYVLFIGFPAAGRLNEQTSRTLRSLSTTILLVTGAIAVFLVVQGSLLQLVIQADRLGGLSRVDNILQDTRLGHYLIARQVLLLIALGALGLVWRARGAIGTTGAYALLLATATGVLVTQSMVSHAAGGDGSVWKQSADFLHILSAALWIGGLIHIGLSMPRWLDEVKGAPRTVFAAESFRRFSVLAGVSVLVLMVSGVLSALAQFSTFSDLWSSSYGWSLVGKMAAMLPLLAIAGLNAFVLQPLVVETSLQVRGAAADGDDAPPAAARLQQLLVQSVRLEALLAMVVLIAVAVLIQLEPPRAAAAAEAAGLAPDEARQERGYYLKANQEGGLVVSLKVDPGQVGVNNFEIGLGSEFGNIGEILLTRLTFNYQDADLGQSELDLPLTGSAKFSTEGSNLSRAGEWEVTASIRRREGDDVRTTFTVPVHDPNAIAAASGGNRWQWPFDGAQSTGAIVALIAGGVLAVVVIGWQGWWWRRTRRS